MKKIEIVTRIKTKIKKYLFTLINSFFHKEIDVLASKRVPKYLKEQIIAKATEEAVTRLKAHYEPYEIAFRDTKLQLDEQIEQAEKIREELETITKEKQIYLAEIERKNRLDYLDKMATAVAHNINNPVGIIRAATDSALQDLKDDLFDTKTELKPLLRRVFKQTEHLHNIIQHFRRFATGNRETLGLININQLSQQVIDYFGVQFQQPNINLNLHLSPHIANTYANAFLLEEVLINLLTNAKEAVEKQKNATVWVRTWVKGEKTGIQVEDNGPGIGSDLEQLLFSPFMTQKTETGTGLGLFTSYKMIESLKGKLSYQNRPEGGACFIISLPISEGNMNENL